MGTGIHGVFGAKKKEARQSIANELLLCGATFSSAESGIGGSAELPDGSTVHNTDLVVQAVEHQVQLGLSPQEAIRKVLVQVPSEGAYVFLFRDFPEQLYLANYNQRLIAVPLPLSSIVVSSTLALDSSELSRAVEVPTNSLSICKAGGFETDTLDPELDCNLSRLIPDNLEEIFITYVRSNPGKTWSTIIEKALLPLFPSTQANLLVPVGFRIAEKLAIEGDVVMRKHSRKGVTPDSSAVEAGFWAVE
jgi:hypothetical protein